MPVELLTRSQLEQFSEEGFLAIPSLLNPSAIEEVRAFLDPLFARYDELPLHVKRDVGVSTVPGTATATVGCAEINRPSKLDSRLKRSAVFQACGTIATQLCGRRAAYAFDHAIYKAPFNESEVQWHQDHAYSGQRTPYQAVHFWIPMQDVTLANGCMQFVPRSHLHGLRPHMSRANEHVLIAPGIDSSSAIACPIPIGGATIHSPLTLHYTGPNNTAAVRGAWILHFAPWGRFTKFMPSRLVERFRNQQRQTPLGTN